MQNIIRVNNLHHQNNTNINRNGNYDSFFFLYISCNYFIDTLITNMLSAFKSICNKLIYRKQPVDLTFIPCLAPHLFKIAQIITTNFI